MNLTHNDKIRQSLRGLSFADLSAIRTYTVDQLALVKRGSSAFDQLSHLKYFVGNELDGRVNKLLQEIVIPKS